MLLCASLLSPCGHLLGKGWSRGSRLWCLIVSLLLSHWCPGSGVVLDYIYSWSLPSLLPCLDIILFPIHPHRQCLQFQTFQQIMKWDSLINLFTLYRSQYKPTGYPILPIVQFPFCAQQLMICLQKLRKQRFYLEACFQVLTTTWQCPTFYFLIILT